MPTGRVKVFDTDKQYGFVVHDGSVDDLYVDASDVDDGSLTPGDVVEFEISDSDDGAHATNVRVVHPAPQGNPVGRVMNPPPSWDDLEEMDRKRRQRRRRRR